MPKTRCIRVEGKFCIGLLNLVPKGTHTYSKYIKPKELIYNLKQSGFKIHFLSPVWLNPIASKWTIGDDCLKYLDFMSIFGINYILCAQKF